MSVWHCVALTLLFCNVLAKVTLSTVGGGAQTEIVTVHQEQHNKQLGSDFKSLASPVSNTRKKHKREGDNHFDTASGFTVLSPVKNAQWVRGTTQTIMWDTDINGVDLVYLEWSRATLLTWNLITPQPVGNVGYYQWQIPLTVDLSSGYFEVQVRSEDSTYSESSGYFYMLVEGSSGISSIITPVQTTTWFPSVPAPIQWTTVGNIQFVKIEITKLTTLSWTTLNASVPNTGSYVWNVPSNQENSIYYYIRITDTANSGNTIESDDFQIAQGDIVNFQSPVHTDTWLVGNTYTIQWLSMGTITTISLDFTSCWTCDWITIEHNIANTGSYVWTVPTTAEIRDTTIIRITDNTPGGAGEELQSPQFRVRSSSGQIWQPSLFFVVVLCAFVFHSI